jgi:branched-chain amino acid transport system permease protein
MEILPQLLVNALISGSIYALASSGLALSYGLLRILNFAHGHFMMLGAYLFYALHIQAGLGIFAASLGTLLGVAAISGFSMATMILPFAKSNFVLAFVSTLTLSIMLESIVSMVFGVNVKSLSVGSELTSWEIYGVYITPLQLIIIGLALFSLGVLAFCLHCTSLGRRLRAMSQFEAGAQALGINSRRMQYLVFMFGALLAALTGVLVGFETNLQPVMGDSYTIKAFAAMVLGGLGNIWGTVVGAYLLALIENLGIGLSFWDYSLPAGYKDSFAFFIVLVMLLWRPQGLFGRRQRSV